MPADNAYEYDAKPEQMQRHMVALRRLITKRRERWYNQFSLKGPRDPRTGKWPRAVLPLLFHSHEEAKEYARAVPIFKNMGGLARSYSIEKTMLREAKP
jgi:hypothetical protein